MDILTDSGLLHVEKCAWIMDFIEQMKGNGINVRHIERESRVARGTISLFMIGERPNIPVRHVDNILYAIESTYGKRFVSKKLQ